MLRLHSFPCFIVAAGFAFAAEAPADKPLLRNVEIIHNDKPCHVCHDASGRINGKLIIDRSMQPTSALIARVREYAHAGGRKADGRCRENPAARA